MTIPSILLVALLAANPDSSTANPSPDAAAPKAEEPAQAPAAQPTSPLPQTGEPKAPGSPAAPAPSPVPDQPVAKPPPPTELSVGLSGLFKPFLWTHTWFTWDAFAPNVANKTAPVNFNYASMTACTTPVCSTFRIKRMELGFTGSVLSGRLMYKAAFDPSRLLEFINTPLAVNITGGGSGTVTAKQPAASTVTILNDVLATYVFEYAELTAGQFRIPVSYEGYNGSLNLLLPERALSSRTYGDRRDLGLKATKNFKYFGYGLFLLNGQPQNTLDNNNAKEMALRLEFFPVKGMLIGAVVDSTVGDADKIGRRFRLELDLRYENGPFVFQGEIIRGQDRLGATQQASRNVDSYGFYAAAGFTFIDVLQPVIRFGHYDPDMGRDYKAVATVNPNWGGANVYEIGLNWYIKKNEAKIQASYSLFDWTSVSVPEGTLRADGSKVDRSGVEHQIIISNQLSF